jgi:hypothetical protein
MYSRARWFSGVPRGRLPIVPASIPTCTRAFCSEKTPGVRAQEDEESERRQRIKARRMWRAYRQAGKVKSEK